MSGRIYGIVLAEVSDLEDPLEQGRVKVSFPSRDGLESQWAPIVRPLASGG